MADRLAENGAIQYALANPEAVSKRVALSGYIMGALNDWLKNPFPPSSRLAAPGRLRGKFFDSGIAPLAMDFTSGQYASGSAGTMSMKSFSDIVTFSRTSNATITKSDGTIGYAPHNLLTYSEQFDNAAWSKTTTTVTANAIASPVGTTTGDTLTAGGANSTTLHSYTAIAQPYTFSIYIRRRTGTGTIEITADGSTYVAKTITSDWARFDTTITPTAGTRTPGVRIVTSGDAIDVWGAQLEIGSTATTYNPTTVKNLLGYTEAFDNAAWTKSNSFVQSNLLTYSEAFDNAAWLKGTGGVGSAPVVTANNKTAPNGYQTADTVVLALNGGTTSADLSWLYQNVSVTTGIVYTFSVYLKASTASDVGKQVRVGGISYTTIVTLTDSWQRIEITATAVSTGSVSFGYRLRGSEITNNVSIDTWGAQLVQGSDAGAYRRTDAAALPVFYPNHNGVVCAEKLVENTTASVVHNFLQTATTIVGTTYTSSIYVKAAERTWVVLYDVASDTGRYFDIANGVTGNIFSGTPTTSTITSVGNGYYRISISAAATGTTGGFRVYPATGNGGITYTGDGTSGFYLFGAQFSDSASLDPYVLNAAAAPSAQAYYGARFDYDPVTLAPKGLLIEESRVNLLLNSSLDGTNLATQSITTTAAARTLSFYGTGTVTLSGTHSATVTGTGAYPTRTTYTYTPTAGTLTLTVSGDVKYAQDELGSFATSFIPTAGSTVTRAADVAVIQGSNFYSWYNQNEGSVLINVLNNGLNVNVSYVNINDGSTSNVLAHYYNNVTTQSAFAQTTNGAVQANIILTSGTVLNNTLKANGAYKVNDFAFSVNSSSVGTDTSGITSIATQLNIGRNATGTATSIMNGTIKQISYYNTRLPNNVLQSLTA